MFANVAQPSIVSLFSSTGSEPLQLFSQHVDPSPALRADSLIHLLNDSTLEPKPSEPGVLVRPHSEGNSDGEEEEGRNVDRDRDRDRRLCQTVLHIQSPTLRTTFIRCPPALPSSPAATPELSDEFDDAEEQELGLSLPWMHVQVCRLGEREWAFEVGVVDRGGRKGVIRCSTFQKEATVTIHHDPPLLHVPLHFPSASTLPLTSWNTIAINLPEMIQQFRVISVSQQQQIGYQADADDEPTHPTPAKSTGMLPSGALGGVTYVKVYANCRLRRIWFSENKRGTLPWELELYASSSIQ